MLRFFPLLLLAAPALAAKPNVVLVVIDGLGQTDLGCYGSTYHKTPNLDAFAKSGVKITDATASAPVSAPSRAALLTGKHPARLNLTDAEVHDPVVFQRHSRLTPVKTAENLPLDEVTLAEELKKSGYVTGHVGRWDLGRKGFGPADQGFDTSIGVADVVTVRVGPSPFAPFETRETLHPERVPLSGLEKAADGEYLTDRLTTEAEKFIAANKAKPFFLHLSHYAPRPPLQAKKDDIAKYKAGKLGQQGNPTYAAMVASIDDSVGRIVKALDDAKLTDNTIVIVTSSCGGYATLASEKDELPPTFNAPYRDGQGFLYEGGVRVPFLIRGPGVRQGNASATSVDVMPTVLALCGVTSELKFDGHNLFAPFRPEQLPPIVSTATYLHFPHYSAPGGRPGGAVRADQWKYIEYFDSEKRELFDLSKDVSESRNLIADQPDKAKEMAKKLAEWRKEVGAKMPKPNPDYKPNLQAKDGSITLKASDGDAHGVMLRFEPLPHKNTFGFWVNKDDYLTWEFTVTEPGTFAVELLQGCGKGQGGSEVEVSVGESKFTHTVKDTGGWQAFEKLAAGKVVIEKAGRHTLTVKAKTKPGAAVMDLRQLVLNPVK